MCASIYRMLVAFDMLYVAHLWDVALFQLLICFSIYEMLVTSNVLYVFVNLWDVDIGYFQHVTL